MEGKSIYQLNISSWNVKALLQAIVEKNRYELALDFIDGAKSLCFTYSYKQFLSLLVINFNRINKGDSLIISY
jgi:hypothetical protein